MPASTEDLMAAAASIVDGLAYMRGPQGELIYMQEPQRIAIAFHLARVGIPPADPARAVIKARGVPDRPGQFAGMVDWVPVDSPDRDDLPVTVSAQGPPVDLAALDDALPWHVKTKIEGNFQ